MLLGVAAIIARRKDMSDGVSIEIRRTSHVSQLPAQLQRLALAGRFCMNPLMNLRLVGVTSTNFGKEPRRPSCWRW